MAKVHTFSSKGTETDKIDEIKQYCERHKLVFSRVVCELLAKWHEDRTNGER